MFFLSEQLKMLFIVFLLIVSLEATKSHFLVKTLPGFSGDLPFTLETGYIGVGESDEFQLFYYFIESEGNPREDPLIFWLNGGPGCSALSALLYEIGPIAFNYEYSALEKLVLEINPHRWTKVANIVFIDQPAGAGFSYAKNPEAYKTNDTSSSKVTYNFMRKWLMDHPRFLNNPLYVAGESYTGILIPMIVDHIYNGNEVGEAPQINIKGYLLGNAWTNMTGDTNARVRYANHMALLSDAIYKSVKENCNGQYMKVDPNNSLCINDLQVVNKCLEKVNLIHILEPQCERLNTLKSGPLKRRLGAFENIFMDIWSLPQVRKLRCLDDEYLYCNIWANKRDVREALHIREVYGDTEWARCNVSFRFSDNEQAISYTHNVQSTVGYHQRLSHKHCRALIYSGDHDMGVPYLATLGWIESLNLTVIDDWRPWFVEEQVAGYTMKYSKDDYSLTFTTIKGGGHTASTYKPKECLSMVRRWLANNPL